MASPPSLRELKRKFVDIIDDDSLMRKANRKLFYDSLPRRIPIKIEDLDPAVLEERHNRVPKDVCAPTNYHAKTVRPPRFELTRKAQDKTAALLERARRLLKSKSTDANDDSKYHVTLMNLKATPESPIITLDT